MAEGKIPELSGILLRSFFAQRDARNVRDIRAAGFMRSRALVRCHRGFGAAAFARPAGNLSLRARTTTHSAAGRSVEGLLEEHSPRGSADASCSRACVLPHACDIVAMGCMRPAGKAAIPAGGSELSSDPGYRGREQPAACKAGTRTFPLLGHAKGGASRPCARRRPHARARPRPRAPAPPRALRHKLARRDSKRRAAGEAPRQPDLRASTRRVSAAHSSSNARRRAGVAQRAGACPISTG